MALCDGLNTPLLTTPISAGIQSQILSRIWDEQISDAQNVDDKVRFDPYFGYYTAQCHLALHDRGRHASARTHEDIAFIVQNLRAGETRESIKQMLSSRLSIPKPANVDDVLDGSVNLAVRLALMVEVGGFKYGFSGRREVLWKTGTLKDFLTNYFRSSRTLGQDGVKLERLFNARNLGRIARIEIEWTSNLFDHLRLIDDERKVAIFHHAGFLNCQQNRYVLAPPS
jgi:hypothetical protein